MNFRSKLIQHKKKLIIGGSIILVLLLIFRFTSNRDDQDLSTKSPKTVDYVMVQNIISGASAFSLVGKIEFQDDAAIRSETAGEVNSIRVGLGDSVTSGQVIASLKNASQQAEVMRARAVLDGTESNLNRVKGGTTENLNVIKNNIRTVYNIVSDSVFNKTDQFINNPNSSLPEVLIFMRDKGLQVDIQSGRVKLQDVLIAWDNSVSNLNQINSLNDVDNLIKETQRDVLLVQNFLDLAFRALSETRATDNISQTNIDKYTADVSSARSSLNSGMNNLLSTYNSIRPQLSLNSKSQDEISAEANVNQAKAGLLSAQVNLEKTIIRSPITGKINSIDLKIGDYVNAFQDIAQVVGSGEIEIVSFISDQDRKQINVGDKVLINKNTPGNISRIAPSVNPNTQKIEIRIKPEKTDGLVNGQSVSIDIVRENTAEEDLSKNILIPLSAVRVNSEGSFIFKIENNKVIEKAVSLGRITGGNVLVEQGLTLEDYIILDARGLQIGQEVKIKDNI